MSAVKSTIKKCCTCNKDKPLAEFSKNSSSKDGLQYKCKECDREYQRLQQARKSPEEKLEYYRKYRESKRHDHGWRLNQLLNSAKSRARNKKLYFSLTLEDLEDMYPNNGLCPVFGTVLEWGDRGFREHSPSIDRIDSDKGYTVENCQIISWKANRIKADFTLEDLRSIVEFLGG